MHKAEQTRKLILRHALDAATKTCLSDLTIGKLAKTANLSKSGLFAHFKSKENLQVSVIEYSGTIFKERVIDPVRTDHSYVEQLCSLLDNWIEWYKGLAKSCIFLLANIEYDGQPGPVQDTAKQQLNNWIRYLTKIVDKAKQNGELSTQTNAKQFVYEMYSLYIGSHIYKGFGHETNNRELLRTAFQNLIDKHRV